MVLGCWCIIIRMLKGRGRPGITGPPPGRIEIDAGQEGGEFGGGHLDAIGPGGREAEGAALESLDVGIAIPSFLVCYTIVARSGCRGCESSAPRAIGRDGSWE
jgi:hypothetical protein